MLSEFPDPDLGFVWARLGRVITRHLAYLDSLITLWWADSHHECRLSEFPERTDLRCVCARPASCQHTASCVL